MKKMKGESDKRGWWVTEESSDCSGSEGFSGERVQNHVRRGSKKSTRLIRLEERRRYHRHRSCSQSDLAETSRKKPNMRGGWACARGSTHALIKRVNVSPGKGGGAPWTPERGTDGTWSQVFSKEKLHVHVHMHS